MCISPLVPELLAPHSVFQSTMFARFLQTRPRLENALSALDRNRLKLPILSLSAYFPTFNERPVSFYEVPTGPWSSPIGDVLLLAKIVACAEPRTLMEVGSFRGYTALTLARHMRDDAKLVTVDRYPEHGEVYRNTEIASRIERRVTQIESIAFSQDTPGSYDFIFLDAGHQYEEVKNDTEILLPLLSPTGFFLWHDYANWGRFSRHNGVPEYLHHVSTSHAVLHVDGSGLAIHSPWWDTAEGQKQIKECLGLASSGVGSDPWATASLR